MGTENSERIQTSILNAAEKKALVWLAERQPKWMTSDCLTYIGVFGAAAFMILCWLGNFNLLYLWLAPIGLLINWYGDSLDGTLARVRKTQRPVYGFFIDHSTDALTTCMITAALGLSPMMYLSIGMLIMAGYLCMSIYTYLTTIVMSKFRLTYASLGPTEMRLIIMIVILLYGVTPWSHVGFNIGQYFFSVFDIVGLLVGITLFVVYIVSMAQDLRRLAKQDPPQKSRLILKPTSHINS